MNYRPIGHMQKQISSISETVQSSPNSSNSCTVQSLEYRFNTKLMSVRQIRHPRPSSRTQSAHVEQNRWCPRGTSTTTSLARCWPSYPLTVNISKQLLDELLDAESSMSSDCTSPKPGSILLDGRRGSDRTHRNAYFLSKNRTAKHWLDRQ